MVSYRYVVNSLIRFLTGPKTSWVTLLIGLIFAALSFTVFAAEANDAAPSTGLPDDAEVVLVENALADMPNSEGTAAVIVFAKDSGEFTESEQQWLQGEFDPLTQSLTGGVNEVFLEFTNIEVMGEPFLPPASLSEDNTTAVVTVPMAEIADIAPRAERVAELRALAVDAALPGITAYVTGPEGFQVDLAGVFDGADFVLYRNHPSLVHSDFCVVLAPEAGAGGDLNARDAGETAPTPPRARLGLRKWTEVQAASRLCVQVNKGLISASVTFSEPADASTPACLRSIAVEETEVRRFNPERNKAA